MDAAERNAPAPRRRIAAFDAGRGAALVGMAIYHLSWDNAYFHLAPADLPTIPPMRLFSHAVAGAFLALAGASLALAHRDTPHWRAFWRRIGVVGGAAALVTFASFLFAPQEMIYFGILHCIAAASLLAAPLLLAPAWVALALGALVTAAPLLVASPLLDAPALVWFGLGTAPPPTLDWRPLAPWAGIVFVSLGLTRLYFHRLIASPAARWRPAGLLGRALASGGRHSLAIYLLHQPVLLAVVFAMATLTGAGARWEAAEFTNVCQRECVAGGGKLQICAPACACVLRGLREAGLSHAIARDSLDDAQQEHYSRVVQSCRVGP